MTLEQLLLRDIEESQRALNRPNDYTIYRRDHSKRIQLLESKMHRRFHEILPGSNLNQIQIQYRYYVAHNIGKRFMGYMWDDCWG
jgi:hypothetical protein